MSIVRLQGQERTPHHLFSNFDNEEKEVMVRFTLAPPFKASRNLWNDLIVMLAGQLSYMQSVCRKILSSKTELREVHIFMSTKQRCELVINVLIVAHFVYQFLDMSRETRADRRYCSTFISYKRSPSSQFDYSCLVLSYCQWFKYERTINSLDQKIRVSAYLQTLF